MTVLTNDEIAAYVAGTDGIVAARLSIPLLILGAILVGLICWTGSGWP